MQMLYLWQKWPSSERIYRNRRRVPHPVLKTQNFMCVTRSISCILRERGQMGDRTTYIEWALAALAGICMSRVNNKQQGQASDEDKTYIYTYGFHVWQHLRLQLHLKPFWLPRFLFSWSFWSDKEDPYAYKLPLFYLSRAHLTIIPFGILSICAR